jgi:hypothetical protein
LQAKHIGHQTALDAHISTSRAVLLLRQLLSVALGRQKLRGGCAGCLCLCLRCDTKLAHGLQDADDRLLRSRIIRLAEGLPLHLQGPPFLDGHDGLVNGRAKNTVDAGYVIALLGASKAQIVLLRCSHDELWSKLVQHLFQEREA